MEVLIDEFLLEKLRVNTSVSILANLWCTLVCKDVLAISNNFSRSDSTGIFIFSSTSNAFFLASFRPSVMTRGCKPYYTWTYIKLFFEFYKIFLNISKVPRKWVYPLVSIFHLLSKLSMLYHLQLNHLARWMHARYTKLLDVEFAARINFTFYSFTE